MSKKDSERYYWIKLKDSLLTSEKVDFLMRQKDGANYVVLYQCLCLKLINNNGVLGKTIGEILIPYDVNKIFGETKGWFTVDTIRVALELYKSLGLIYLEENGLYRITDFEELVGSETYSAIRMREHRANNVRTKSEQCSLDNKILDNKILDIENEIEINNNNTHTCERSNKESDEIERIAKINWVEED